MSSVTETFKLRGEGGSKDKLPGKEFFERISLVVSTTFDIDWYISQSNSKFNHKSESLVHFLLIGLGQNISPTPIFDPSWFSVSEPTQDLDEISFIRFIQRGWAKGNDPHPLFDLEFYTSQINGRLDDSINPITHFRQVGWKAGLKPHPLFDPSFYLDQNKVELGVSDDPLSHYLRVGNARGYITSPHFDTTWYRAAYRASPSVLVDALVDYICNGYKEGRLPNSGFDPQRYLQFEPSLGVSADPLSHFLKHDRVTSDHLPPGVSFDPQRGFIKNPLYLTKVSRHPFVSIIITNLNGKRHLPDLYLSLKKQSYQNFEIIFVDDGSSDDSIQEAKKWEHTRIVSLPTQTGFAGANNAGLAVAKGELIALLNNDVRVHSSWLESLITRMASDQLIGAVTSKVRFWGKFSRLTLISKTFFSIDRKNFFSNLDYPRVFVRLGSETNSEICAASQSEERFILEIDLPNHQAAVGIPIMNGESKISVLVDGLPNRQSTMHPGPGLGSLVVNFKHSPVMNRSGFYVINNAGSVEGADGMPHDRGIYEVDCGQYDAPQEISFFCGCSVLIRRSALNGNKLFISEFVAYYEDSELSLRLRRSGYKISYEPTSIVEHRHSSTTIEKSAFWLRHTWKNSALFKYILSGQQDDEIIKAESSRLNHMRFWYPSQVTSTEQELKFADMIEETIQEMVVTSEKLKAELIPERNGFRVGLFNPYWNTLGGGEAHALNVAEVVRDGRFVELISTEDFDLEAICEFFGVDSSFFIKRLVSEMTTEITSEYDLFINSCYQSLLPSKARESMYIVSFPGRTAPREFISSYKFLPNSSFTRQWMLEYWSSDDVNEQVIYPLVPEAFYLTRINPADKEAFILSVGRFASEGHVKNQLEIARVFRRVIERDVLKWNWKLVLIGSANDLDYVERVRACLQGTNHDIIIDASFEVVLKMYKTSSIYLHASGLGQDLSSNPERAEHFGMAVAQGAAAGCFPVVFNGAGPAEIVSLVGIGDLFNNEEQMEISLMQRCRSFEIGSTSVEDIESIVKAASIFNAQHFQDRLQSRLISSVREGA